MALVRASPLHAFFQSPAGQRFGHAAHVVFLGGLVAFLAWRLAGMGVGDVLAAVPRQPLFYLFFLAGFLVLPVSEAWIYSRYWPSRMAGMIWPFIVKRAYNFGFLDLSGEAYIALWARSRFGLSVGEVWSSVKDVNLLSAAASNLLSPIILLSLLALGSRGTLIGIDPRLAQGAIAVTILAALATVAIGVFQKRLISGSRRLSWFTFSVHGVRYLLGYVFQLLQWLVVLPQAGLTTWLAFLAAHIVLLRLPLLPNKDLLFVTLSVGLAKAVHAPEAAVAALFLTGSALQQAVNLLIFATETVLRGRRRSPASSPGESA